MKTELLKALHDLQCFNCGTLIRKPQSEIMVEIFLESADRYDRGILRHDEISNPRAPFERKGQCWMCQPLRDLLKKEEN